MPAESTRGPRIIDMLWDELDRIARELYQVGKPRGRNADEWHDFGILQGRFKGVAHSIATISNPYDPSPESVREIAIQRYQEWKRKVISG